MIHDDRPSVEHTRTDSGDAPSLWLDPAAAFEDLSKINSKTIPDANMALRWQDGVNKHQTNKQREVAYAL